MVEFNEKGKVVSIEEKLQKPKSHFAVAELYFYNNDVKNIAKIIQKSNRGELEITCVNRVCFHRNNLYVKQLSRSSTWLDTGIQNAMLDVAQFVETIESRQGWLSNPELTEIVKCYLKGNHRDYMLSLLVLSN